jgi:hypothetical protein
LLASSKTRWRRNNTSERHVPGPHPDKKNRKNSSS